ncbi:putative carboxylic ester hydrolase [Sugiyamaella lignohabitans]|uniref:Putative carboxylic ester hydrolase n=1 Tax=Sugiyamaella lignohabitans TaxID=796027 RepID=A0A167D0P5_9ASCO|nr:putative carboxylic ester hydrolase [Sugiyamaella lignohabitans]ANB12334.1 putative carboxylic ester hydrolase [Sugiyamaella lignohabitans]
MGILVTSATRVVRKTTRTGANRVIPVCVRLFDRRGLSGSGPRLTSDDKDVLKVAWYYATDVPKSKPEYFNWTPTTTASKFSVFSEKDSARLEAAYQRIKLERKRAEDSKLDPKLLDINMDEDDEFVDKQSIGSATPTSRPIDHPPVPVKEDGLFLVDLDKRELRPCYWDGPVYDVRRGTWFYSGSKLVPCPENLAADLESAYQKELGRLKRLKVLETQLANAEKLKTKNSQGDQNDDVAKDNDNVEPVETGTSGKLVISKLSSDLKSEKAKGSYAIECNEDPQIDVVKFSDESPSVAYGYKSLSSGVLQKIASTLGGSSTKLLRGYRSKGDERDKEKEPQSLADEPKTTTYSSPLLTAMANSGASTNTISKIEDTFLPWSAKSSESKMEEQMKNDYDESNDGHENGPEGPVDHLVLCIHGIGQKLSQKVDSVNFVHDINMFRKLTKTLQSGDSPINFSSPITGEEEDGEDGDVHQNADNSEAGQKADETFNSTKQKEDPEKQHGSSQNSKDNPTKTSTGNSKRKRNRVQVLPVLWRHDMSFGRKASSDQKEFLSVQDINVEGIPAIRTLFSDVIADFLLFSEPVHKKQMLEIVTYQLNRIYREFCKHNPIFAKNPKVSIIAHSLGSVIGYEALRAAHKVQKQRKQPPPSSFTTSSSSKDSSLPPAPPSSTYLEFQVSNYITIGSPLGLFLLIGGSTIRPEELNIGAMYNLFHPSDPISYRVEPLVTPYAAKLKPVPIPFTKGGLTTQIQELSELGSKISQSASMMWSNITSSLTKSDLLEQIKKTDEEEAAVAAAAAALRAKAESKEDSDDSSAKSDTQQRQKDLPSEQLDVVNTKLKALNPAGRLDYVLQEGVLDISILSAIASHVSYFETEDIANFVLQILYKHAK